MARRWRPQLRPVQSDPTQFHQPRLTTQDKDLSEQVIERHKVAATPRRSANMPKACSSTWPTTWVPPDSAITLRVLLAFISEMPFWFGNWRVLQPQYPLPGGCFRGTRHSADHATWRIGASSLVRGSKSWIAQDRCLCRTTSRWTSGETDPSPAKMTVWTRRHRRVAYVFHGCYRDGLVATALEGGVNSTTIWEFSFTTTGLVPAGRFTVSTLLAVAPGCTATADHR